MSRRRRHSYKHNIANEAVSYTSLTEYGKARGNDKSPSQQLKVHMHDRLSDINLVDIEEHI